MIQTARLHLLPCELPHLESFLRSKKELEVLLQVKIPESWPQFPEAIPYAYEHLKADPSLLGWGTYLFIHTNDRALIGSGGFKGKVNDLGRVEIGYEIVPEYQNQGLATEAVQGLINFAFAEANVTALEAHTLAEPNASTKVLQKAGLQYNGLVQDPDDGALWHWSLSKGD